MPSDPLDVWFANELAKLYAVEPTNSPGILLGFPVWGDKYIDRFARFCLPSLLAPANADALRALNAKVLIFTAKGAFLSLWRKTLPLEKAAIRLQFDWIPDALLKNEADPNHKYLLLGTVQNLLIQHAARTGMGFHMIMPDIVYSERYFEALAGLVGQHEAVAHSCLSADIDSMGVELDVFRRGDALGIPARALGDMGWRHVHQQTRGALLTGDETDADTPHANFMVWQGRDAIHMASPHTNPAWIGPDLCRRAPVLTPVSLDAEIPGLMPSGFHLPGPDDDMVVVELSDDSKTAPKRAGIENFIHLCWLQMNFDDRFLPVARRRTLIPIEPQAGGLTEAEIETQHAALVGRLVDGKLKAMEDFMAHTSRIHRRMLRV